MSRFATCRLLYTYCIWCETWFFTMREGNRVWEQRAEENICTSKRGYNRRARKITHWEDSWFVFYTQRWWYWEDTAQKNYVEATCRKHGENKKLIFLPKYFRPKTQEIRWIGDLSQMIILKCVLQLYGIKLNTRVIYIDYWH